MAKRNYKFTVRKHSVSGAVATIMGIAAIVALIISVRMSLAADGHGSVYLGTVGVTGMFVGLAGLILALGGLKNEKTFKLFSAIGAVISFVGCGLWIAVYMLGFLL